MTPAEPGACDTCGSGEPMESERCASSQSPCGHHCNHSWSHDSCCWCGGAWGEAGAFTPRSDERECNCLIPYLEGAGQHSPGCSIFTPEEREAFREAARRRAARYHS